MKKMNKMRFLAKTIISSFVLLAIFTACEVGLGSNVDTAAPKIEILSPEPSSTHKGEFQITGTASDEIAVRSVSVNLLENGTARYSYNANYDAASGKWSVSIPTLDENNKPIVEDLKYEIQAIATDTDGKTSVATRSVQVDNSAPTVLVNSPSLFNDNKSTFFRQLRVSGSCYDASEISSVKVSFYKESKEGEVPFELVEGETMLTFTAEGTNTWELTKDLDEKDTFFANNTIYNFFVVAEDITGNKNTYFFRYGDFYKPGILEDVNKDSFISFPSMQQIGKLDQGFDIENATSNLTAQKLETIQIPCSSDGINDSNFYYRSQTASNVSWGNIENNDSSEPKQIPMEMDITGQIKSTDGTDILTNSIRFEIYSLDDNENWIVPSENMELDSSGSTVAFTIKLQKEVEEYIKSGHYRITVYYQTIASQNSDRLSAEKIFDISAGMPILTETGLSEKGTSPFNLQVFTNKDSVVLSGRALKGDRRTPVDMISVICNENSYESPEIAADGTWSIKITEEGTYSFELKVEDGGNTTTVTRTVIIDRTKPLIDNLGFNQNSAKNAVTISSFITDENAIESIHYAFVKGDSVTLENLDSTEWKKADNKSAMNIALEEPNGFEQGPWTLFVKATDKAGNIENKQYTGVLDLDAPAFTTSFATDSIPENGYLNKDFSYLSSILDNSTVIAKDNYKIKEVKITAKKDGVVQNEYGYTKTIEKTQLTKADFDKLPIIEAKTTNEGKWIVTFEIYDLNNNKAEKTVDFSMDVTKPTVSIEKVPQAKDDNTSPFECRGSASDNVSGVSTICVSLDGSNFESFEGLKSWGKELAITAKGNGCVFAYAIDGAGNKSETVEKNFTFDSSKPTLNITTQEGLTDWNIGTNFGLEGTVSDDWGLPESPVTIIQYEKSGESLTKEILLSGVSFVDGKWSISDLPRKNPAEKIEEADIPTKTYTYVIEAKDNAEKESTKTVNVSIDKTAPSKNEISTPKDKLGTNAINSETFTFTGVAEDLEGDARTGINKIQYAIKTTDTEPTENELKDVATTGSWKFVNEEKLTEGEYFLFVRAVDNAGNKTDFAKEKYQVDFNNPEIDISLDAKQKELFTLAGNISDKDATGQSNGKNITIEITQVGNLDKNKQPLVITPAVEETRLTTINLPVKSVEGQVDSIDEGEIDDYNDAYTYTIKVTDWCGKTVEKTITTKLDTKAPVIELYSLSKSGSSQNVFKTESISLTGSLSDDSKITKLAYMTKLASEDKPNYEASDWIVKENKNTINEELPFTEDEYGNRVLYIWAEDENGNKSSIEEYNFLVDAKAPELTLTSSENAQINAGESYKLSLEAKDSLLDKVVVTAKKDGVTQTGIWFEKTANGGTVITLEGEEILKGAGNEGKWVFSVKAYDMAGGVSDTETISVLVDTTNPEFKTDVNQPHIESTFGPVTVDGKDWYGGQTITLKGQVSDNNEIETVEYLIVEEAEGASYESCSVTKIGDGEYEFKADISVTEHWKEKTIKIKASDSVGNEKTEEITVNVDRNVPTIKITSDTSNIFINSSTNLLLDLICTDEESGVKSVKAKIGSPVFDEPDEKLEKPESDDFTSLTILADKFPKDDGDMGTVFLQIEDNCGNTAQTSFTFRKDTTKPVINFSSHKADDSVDGKIKLSGTIVEAQGLDTSSVTVTTEFKSDIDQELDTSSVTVGDVTVEGLNWSCPIQTGADGYLTITVKAKDSAGNEGTNSITLKVNQKNDRPQIEISNDIYEIDGKKFIEDPKIYFSSSDEDGIDEIKINDEATTKSYTIPSGDGEKNLSFWVRDVDNKEFNSHNGEEDYVDAPVLKYKVTKIIETTEIITTETTEIQTTKPFSFNLNLDSPKINSVQMKIGEEEPKDFDIKQIGGKTDKFDILVDATDGNGIKAVSLKAGEKEIPGTYEGTDETQNGIWKISVDTSELPEGEVEFEITVTDKAGSSSTLAKTLLVDNTSPSIIIESHTKSEDMQVTGSVRLSGNVSDDKEIDGNKIATSGVASLQWLIPTNDEQKKSNEEIKKLTTWKDVVGISSWSYTFENDSEKEITEELSNYANSTYGIEESTGSNIWKLPIYLLATDSVGNQTLKTDFVLYVDPDGDNPKAYISYPTNDLILGGTIRVNGTAEDNESVAEVHLQIDKDGNGKFDEIDRDYLKSYYSIKNDTSLDDWYIVVDGKVNWNISINENGEFNPPKNTEDTENTSSGINIRVRAKDADSNESKIGLWSQPVKITIDDSNPKIGSHAPLRLVQYIDNDDYTSGEKAAMQYIPDMWIKGKWWLVGSVQDENGINEIVIEDTTEFTISTINTEETRIESDENHTDYIFYIPLDTTVMSEDKNSFSFGLHAKDNSEPEGKQTQTISIKYDNTAPELAEKLEYSGSDNEEAITQSNNAVEIASSVTESGSGFQRLAIYFKRTGNDGERIYNPVINKGEDGNGNRINITNDGVKIIDDLPRLTVTKATRTTGTIKHDSLKNNPNIRKGGLVRIAGVERLITYVDPKTGTVTFTPAVDESYTTAEFAYALVVDNFKVENATDWDDSGNPTEISNDDEDMVIESVAKTGATYNWTLAINSKNIPDGPISICYVAYDEAGNCSSLKEISTKVENNPPMIAKVWLGTDLDGDGTISRIDKVNSEEVEYRTDAKKSNSVSVNTTADGETLFTAKGNTTIRPEIVGGNGNLYYKVGNELKILRGKDENGEGDGSILLEVNGETLAGVADVDKKEFSFTIWDSTEECTVGETTLDASLSVTMAVDVVDDIKPTVEIRDLFWESEDKNSLYDNSRNNGHIELSEELPGVFSPEGSGLMDTDDKVSGKITFTGTAYDNVCLGSLVFTFDKFSNTIKFDNSDNSDNSDWSSVEKMDSDGYVFTAKTVSLDQGGHKVNWTLSIDTAKIEKVAATDVNLTVSATDKGSNSSLTEKVESEDETKKNVPSYQVDVVPYITGVVRTGTTNSTLNTYRSKFGNYTAAIGDTLTVTGFNFSQNPLVKVGSKEITENMENGNTSFTMSIPGNSGELTITVNDIESLNHKNNNDVEYNRENDSKDSVTDNYIDNRYIYVWDINHRINDIPTTVSKTAMGVSATGQIYSQYVRSGDGQVMFIEGLAGNEKQIFRCYDQTQIVTGIGVDTKSSTTTRGGTSTLFFMENVGNSGTMDSISSAMTDVAGNGGVAAISMTNEQVKNNVTFEVDKNVKKVKIANNPYLRLDSNISSSFYPLQSYSMKREQNLFSVPHSAKYGTTMHNIWYDLHTKGLKYSYVDSASNTLMEGSMVDWVVIDGGYNGQDRVHPNSTKSFSDGQYVLSKTTNNNNTINTNRTKNTINDSGQEYGAAYEYDLFGLVPSKKSATSCTVTVSNYDVYWKDKLKEGATIAFLVNGTTRTIALSKITNISANNNTLTLTYDSCADAVNANYVTIYTGNYNVVGLDATVEATVKDMPSSSAGKYSAIDVTTQGYPCIAYFDAGNATVKVAYATDKSPTLASDWKRIATGANGGTHVSMCIDNNNVMHISYRDSNGKLVYQKGEIEFNDSDIISDIDFSEATTIDKNGSLTYGTISVVKHGNSYRPCVSYLNSEETDSAIKYATLITLDGEEVWDYHIVPAVKGRYAVSENTIQVAGNSGEWSETQDTVRLSDCSSLIGYLTEGMDVVFLKSENIETTSQQ